MADRSHGVFGIVAEWRDLYTDVNGRYDWDLRPSSPDPLLVAAVQAHERFASLHVYHLEQPAEAAFLIDRLAQLLSLQGRLDFADKKLITEANFEEVYADWNEVFGESVRNGFKASRYFVIDIHKGRSKLVAEEGRVNFQVGTEDIRIKKILARDYEHFWSLYEKIADPAIVRGIVAKIDRLTDDVARRTQGEFFTPLPFTRKALDYIEREIGAHWWRDGKTRLWDMAAGTGNLEYYLPAEALPSCFLSTLYAEDVEHCGRLFPGATVFQYDYLNDDVGNVFDGDAPETQERLNFGGERTWKLPQRLRDDLSDPSLRWIILINPPFATAQQGGATGANKAQVSMTKVRDRMHARDLGETSRELFAQFLFRIRREFASRRAWLGLFSTLKYVNSTNDQLLRDNVFRFRFCRGFIFSSANFAGTSSTNAFPVGFLLWEFSANCALENQYIEVDVFDTAVQKTGTKHLASAHRNQFLTKWIDRPRGTATFPPFSSAITIKSHGPDIRDRISNDFIGSLGCPGNDVQHQNMTALLSGPCASAGGLSITPAIFEQSLVVHAVRLLPRKEWHNDRDQFMQPAAPPLPAEFVNDCIIWSLYANSNHTVAMRDVAYADRTWQIQNHFFPISLAKIRDWSLGDTDIAMQLPTAQDRFVAQWMTGRALSDHANAVVKAATAVWRLYFENMHTLRLPKFKIATWDAGWWQVRNALADVELGKAELALVKEAHDALRVKLLPQITTLGFIG